MVNAQQSMAARMLASALLAVFVLYGLAQIFLVVERVTAAAPTNIIGYQGRLLNSNGVPVSDSSASVIFELYTAVSGGSCVWSNSSATCASATARTVTLSDGLFSEALGDTAAATPYPAIGDTIFGNNSALYLQVTINGETLTPRKQILASGYAINSQLIDGYDTTTAGGTASKVLVLDTNGNLQLTGSPQGTSVGQGSLYINPAAGVVAANEALLDVAVSGSTRFALDAEGDASFAGNVAVAGGTVSSTAALLVQSSSSTVSFDAAGSSLVYVVSGDDFAVGGSSLVAPFSVDESTNTVRIGDGTSDVNDPTITFYASDATDSGSLSYDDTDAFIFQNGNFVHTGLDQLPTVASSAQSSHAIISSLSSTSQNALSELSLFGLSSATTYTAIEGTGTDHKVAGVRGLLAISGGTATITEGSGLFGRIAHTATSSVVQAGGFLAGAEGEYVNGGSGTTSDAYGVYGHASASAGTITNAVGVHGTIDSSAGTVTTGYAGLFTNTSAGTTRYGVYGNASGGTTNYAGYFTGSVVQIDDDATANTPGSATGAGDLYVVDAAEIDGSLYVGDTSGTDVLTFVTGATTGTAMSITADGLTSGIGMLMNRAAGGSDFDGEMLKIYQGNVSATSDGDVLTVDNHAGGDAHALYIVQAQVTDETNGAGGTTFGAQAIAIDITEAGSNDDAIIIRANNQITFAVESDGSVLSDNAYSSAGADYAEYFGTNDATLVATEVVCHDASTANAVKRCAAGEEDVIGAVSTTPGFIGGLPENPATSRTVVVGLNGQIDTRVTAAEGAIAIGDPIAQSGAVDGYGALAHGPTRILGFALESLASGTGTIKVYVNPQWYGGDVLASDGSAMIASADLVFAPLGTATSATNFGSQDIVLRGSQWNGATATDVEMAMRTTVESAGYRLSVVNNGGSEVAYIGESGDIALAGRLYPSDRGTLQTSKYIYYDGSTGAGGDMMRTNASGWSSGSYDFAEMFPSPDALAAGEVVVFGEGKETVRRSGTTTYDAKIAGVVSTKPAFLAGENRPGDAPVALAGRVPTYVSGENGAISIGDPLTSSSKPGYAMKATDAGPILGYAMEAFDGATGVAIAFIRPSYYDGGPVSEAPLAQNTASETRNLASLDVSGALNMNGGSILSIASLIGIGERWRIEEDGDIFTEGRIVQLVQSYGGDDVETYATTSREQTIELSGTAVLIDGRSRIIFEQLDPSFNDVIANTVPYRVYLTPAGMTGMLAAVDRTNEGFRIQEAGSSSGIAVDWLVVAYHKDYAPTPVTPDAIAPVEAAPVVDVEILPSTPESGPEPVVDIPSNDVMPEDTTPPEESSAPEEVPPVEPVEAAEEIVVAEVVEEIVSPEVPNEIPSQEQP